MRVKLYRIVPCIKVCLALSCSKNLIKCRTLVSMATMNENLKKILPLNYYAKSSEVWCKASFVDLNQDSSNYVPGVKIACLPLQLGYLVLIYSPTCTYGHLFSTVTRSERSVCGAPDKNHSILHFGSVVTCLLQPTVT